MFKALIALLFPIWMTQAYTTVAELAQYCNTESRIEQWVMHHVWYKAHQHSRTDREDRTAQEVLFWKEANCEDFATLYQAVFEYWGWECQSFSVYKYEHPDQPGHKLCAYKNPKTLLWKYTSNDRISLKTYATYDELVEDVDQQFQKS
jgi:hypothetical protein